MTSSNTAVYPVVGKNFDDLHGAFAADAKPEDVLIFQTLFLREQLNLAWEEMRDLYREEGRLFSLSEDQDDDDWFLPEEWSDPLGNCQWVFNVTRAQVVAAGIMQPYTHDNGFPDVEAPTNYSDGSPVYVYIGREYRKPSDPVFLERSEANFLRVLMAPGLVDYGELSRRWDYYAARQEYEAASSAKLEALEGGA